jgi:hypothetical protein
MAPTDLQEISNSLDGIARAIDDQSFSTASLLTEFLGVLAAVLLVSALLRLVFRWPLLDAIMGSVLAFQAHGRHGGLPGLLKQPHWYGVSDYVLAAVVVLLFFEWRERHGLDAMAPFREWRRKRQKAKAAVEQ